MFRRIRKPWRSRSIGIYRSHRRSRASSSVVGVCSRHRSVFRNKGSLKVETLNFFEQNEAWLKTRLGRIAVVAEALGQVAAKRPISGKVISDRYTSGLGVLGQPAAEELRDHLMQFITQNRE